MLVDAWDRSDRSRFGTNTKTMSKSQGSTEVITIGSIPGSESPNPYVRLFYQALAQHDIVAGPVPVLDDRWMQEHVHQYDGLHIHWPELSWRGSLPGWYRQIIPRSAPGSWRFAKLLIAASRQREAKDVVRSLEVVKNAGKFIIWTYHNTEPHDEKGAAARYGYAKLAALADLVIAHDEAAAHTFSRRYPDAVEPTIMPHGNYVGVYPLPRGREEVLLGLGLDPALPVFGCIGRIRKYKGFVEAAKAFQMLDGKAQLIVAGAADDQPTVEQLRVLARETPSIALIEGFVDDQRFSDLVNACTAVLLPYRSVTGSGALLAALSFGRAVIVSDQPYFRELLKNELNAGLIIASNAPEAMADGVRGFLEIDVSVRNAAAKALAERYDWQNVVNPVVSRIRALTEVAASR